LIDPSTIARILETADIYDVIQDFVTLKKRGVNHIGLCPFHDEKTPSFTVSQSKGIFKCFGCGKGGNAVNFIMEHEHLSYPEALKYLAKKYNIEVEDKAQTEEDIRKKDEIESLMIVTSFAQKYFTRLLNKHPEGRSVGLSYFVERGFREDIIDTFQLGYSLEEKDAFTTEALKNGYKLDFLVSSGLTIQREDWKVDRFAHRVIFPIHNLAGRVIGFTARTLRNDKKTAKYLNSPESQIYHKSNVLYGLYHAKQAIAKEDKCYIVEGNTDVIALYQAGIKNVVASSGTALTKNQLKLIKRFTDNVTIIFDGDEAGIKASLRGIDLILEEGLNVKVISLPKDEDPDSFSRKHDTESLISELKANETDFIAFKTNLLLDEVKDDPVKKANLISNIVNSIAVIPDTITKSLYIKECSSKLKVDEKVLYNEIRKIYIRKNKVKIGNKPVDQLIKEKPSTPQIPGFIDQIFCEPQEKEIIRYMLNFGDQVINIEDEENKTEKEVIIAEFIIREILNDDLEFKNLMYKKIFEEFKLLMNEGKPYLSKHFTNHTDNEIRELAAELIIPKYKIHKIWLNKGSYYESEEMKLKKVIPKSLISFKSKILLSAEKELIDELKNMDQNSKEEEINEILEKIKMINENKKIISKSLDRIML
jgi:DNA primase